MSRPTIDEAERSAVQLASLCHYLYAVWLQTRNEPARWRPKKGKITPPGDLEISAYSARKECGEKCEPFRGQLRALHGLDGVDAIGEKRASALDALLSFFSRLIAACGRLRGESWASEIGEVPFDSLPLIEHGHFTSLVQQEFAMLRRVPAHTDKNKDKVKDVVAGLDARACGVFFEHKDWTKKKIAEALSCNPRSLTRKRCPNLDAAMKAYRTQPSIRGSKDREGNLEAWNEE